MVGLALHPRMYKFNSSRIYSPTAADAAATPADAWSTAPSRRLPRPASLKLRSAASLTTPTAAKASSATLATTLLSGPLGTAVFE
ncbi:hypothetical protein CC1G_07977 [Coprinopsis cinerea okayama7|uniref:Uncharacterized protein n=1 Tax=Coprinopsis cinerea (strain Okayama-7 / 130 / ATCC MYA-4618 / FGSC 9003) TaxID=240176 RepID=A8P237_COPC7|nr:hypothetical protein CC1G_07977 [Coprinopsis cinerea okayama7\|eukprot:XP_001838236.1 hypothetical protein CC1G_07977 [Coprinopsis cinerea okayama7\